jgi:beta-lactamase regulating signal transducer with metallopeptidase domain
VVIDSFAADVLIKVTIVLIAAALVARALTSRSAAVRHHVWALALAASLALPLLTPVAPRWTIAMLPARDSAPREGGPAHSSAAREGAPVPSSPQLLDDTTAVSAPIIVERAPRQTTNTVDEAAPIAAAAGLIPESTTPQSSMSGSAIAASIWLTGAPLVLARFLFGTIRVWWIARRAGPAGTWARLAHDLARSLALDGRVTFVSGEEDVMPMAWGVVSAHVLLPADADDWPLDRQRVVLLHELAHVKRRDCLTQTMAQVACAAYWFNPMVWIAARRLRAERERACDDLVLAAGTRGSDYADHLLDIARSLRSGAWPTWSAVTMAHRSQLEGRLMAILNPALPRRSPTRAAAAVVAATAFVCVTTLAGVQPVAKAEAAGRAEAAPAPVAVTADDPADQNRPSQPATPAPTPTPAPAPTPLPTLVTPTPVPTPRAAATPLPMPAPFVDVAPLVDIDAPAPAPFLVPLVDPPFVFSQTPPPGSAPARGSRSEADPKVVAALSGALKDENKEVRQQALHALVSMRAPIPTDVFVSLLKDSDPDTRAQALYALGQQRDPKNLDVIVAALKDSNREVRAQATFALSQMRDPRAVDPLATALKDADPEVRSQAAHALGQIRDRRAIDPLIAALKDANAQVRSQAAFALGQIR